MVEIYYDAFGVEIEPDEDDVNPFRYCGEYYDTETGTYYLRARSYDPTIGRFTAEDPIRDGLNWYAYCGGNPIRYIDPSGEAFETIFDAISLGFSIVDVISNPTDVWAWAGLVGDVIDFIPFVTGVGEGIKALGASNKVTSVLKYADDYVKSGVWTLNPWKRGYVIEEILGGMVSNFPIIDKFVVSKGNDLIKYLSSITSIKSIDLTAKTYQKGSKLKSLLRKYVNDLLSFYNKTYNGVNYILEEGVERILEIAIPSVKMSGTQLKVFQEMISEAAEKGVKIIVRMI